MSHLRDTLGTTKARVMLIGITVSAVLGMVLVVALHGAEGRANAAANAAPMAGMPGMDSGALTNAQINAGQGPPGIGPVSELDKTFLIKVRQAGLWEMPAGKLAQTHATSEAVKRAGLHLLDGHSHLDQLVREDASILGVQLPDQASDEQKGCVQQLTAAQGIEFDRLFVNLLRASHGKIFATIAQVRAGTQNDLIRRHARQANQTVLDHMEVLEDTGLVDPKTIQDVATAVQPPAK